MIVLYEYKFLRIYMENKSFTQDFLSVNPSTHTGPIYSIKFTNDGKYVYTGGADKTIKLMNPFKNRLIQSFTKIHSQQVFDIKVLSDASKILSCGQERIIFYWDAIKQEYIKRLRGHKDSVNSICLNNKFESIVISGSNDCKVNIYDLKSNARDPIQILNDSQDSITQVSSRENQIISISLDFGLRVYDIRQCNCVYDRFNTPLISFDISLDGKYAIFAGRDSKLRLYDWVHGKIIQIYKGLHIHNEYKSSIRFNNNNSSIFCSSEDGKLIKYDLLNIPEKNTELINNHSMNISCIDINNFDNKILASSGFDGKICIYQVD